MSVRRAAVWSLTFPFPPPCPLATSRSHFGPFAPFVHRSLVGRRKGPPSSPAQPFPHYVHSGVRRLGRCARRMVRVNVRNERSPNQTAREVDEETNR